MSKVKDFWKTIKYFKEDEFECRCGCGLNNISHGLVESLDTARLLSDTRFHINSACRCISHNISVQGSKSSSHVRGLAVDIKVSDSVSRFRIIDSLIMAGFTRIGIYKNFIHVDNDISKSQNVIWYV